MEPEVKIREEIDRLCHFRPTQVAEEKKLPTQLGITFNRQDQKQPDSCLARIFRGPQFMAFPSRRRRRRRRERRRRRS